MTRKNDNAFPLTVPRHGCDYVNGLTKREYFAGQIITGLATLSAHPQSPDIAGQAKLAVKMTDALIAELNKS